MERYTTHGKTQKTPWWGWETREIAPGGQAWRPMHAQPQLQPLQPQATLGERGGADGSSSLTSTRTCQAEPRFDKLTVQYRPPAQGKLWGDRTVGGVKGPRFGPSYVASRLLAEAPPYANKEVAPRSQTLTLTLTLIGRSTPLGTKEPN